MSEADLEQLHARLEKPIYNLVYRWVWKPDEAQDIVQETFVRLWRMRGRVELQTVEPLAYRIAINLAASRQRSKKLWRWASLEAIRERAASELTTEAAASAGQQAARLRAAVDALPEELRRVVVLCQFSELSYAEVAGILSIPEGTVGSRRNRALRRLREVLSREPGPRERVAPESV